MIESLMEVSMMIRNLLNLVARQTTPTRGVRGLGVFVVRWLSKRRLSGTETGCALQPTAPYC